MASKSGVSELQRISLKILYLKNKSFLIYAFLILLAAIILRTFNLLSIPIFADEAIYIRWAQVMKAVASLRFLPLTDGKQPLFMWSIIPFFKIFSDPLIAGRMVSAVCGIGSLVGIFVLTQVLLKNIKTSLIAALLYAVSPFSVFFDRMALADSMLSMFGTWVFVFGIITAKTRRLDTAMLTGFSLGGALLTKSPAIFFAALLPLTILTSELSLIKTKDRYKILQLIGLWFVSWIIGYAIYNILRLGPSFDMISSRNQDYIFGLDHLLKTPFDPLRPHFNEAVEWYWALLPGTTLIAAICTYIFGLKKYFKLLVFLGLWFLIPLLAESGMFKVYTARYILFTTTPLFILAALLLGKIIQLQKAYYILLLTLVVLPSIYINFMLLTSPKDAPLPKAERAGYLENWTSGYGIREVAQFIKDEHNREPDRQIIVGTEGFFGTLPDGLMIYNADIPKVVVKGVGLAINTVHDSLINAKRAGDKVYLVVNTSRLEDGAYEQGLKLIESYPKAIHPSGVSESLVLFEVTDETVRIADKRYAKEAEEKLKSKK